MPQHAWHTEEVRRVALHLNIAQPFPADSHPQHRAHIVPVGWGAEIGGELHGAEIFRRIKGVLLQPVRQEEGRRPLRVLPAAVKQQPAAAVLCPVFQLVPLRRGEEARVGHTAASLRAAPEILRPLQKFMIFHLSASSCARSDSSSSKPPRSAPAPTPLPAQTPWRTCAARRSAGRKGGSDCRW